jgi:hypothetical protein
MKKNTAMLLCGSLAIASLNCGGQPLDSEGRAESTTPGSQQSDLVKSVVSTRNPDGTYTQRSYYQTRQEYNAELAQRIERDRLRKQGIRLSQAPAEIGPDPTCAAWDSSWLWPEGSAYGPDSPNSPDRCCVSGAGGAYINNMCPFSALGAMWSGGRSGFYMDPLERCYYQFGADEIVWDSSCTPDVNWFSHD